MPKVSVIIPTYQHQDYVLQTLDSVFAQTFTDYEVIVINDGSPDRTAEVLAPLTKSGRIRYFEQTNRGQSSARNYGFAQSRGKFIAFLDDDDLWPPEKLAWQTELLHSSEAVLVGGRVIVIRQGQREGDPAPSPLGSITREKLADGAPFHSPGQTLIRRETLEKVGGFDTTVWGADDYDLYLRLAQHGRLYVEDKVSLFYRLHDANASRQRDRMLVNCYKVVKRHFPQTRSAHTRKAFRWLYAYAGRDCIVCAKEAIRSGAIRAFAKYFRLFSIFLWPMINDFRLAKEIMRDVLPTRLSRGVDHTKKRLAPNSAA